MKYARVENGVVKELFDETPVLHPDLMKQIVEAPDEVEQRWTYDSKAFAPPKPDPEAA